MTLYNKDQAEEAEALKEAMSKAAEQIKNLKTFETKGDPVETPAGKSQSLVTIQVKVTGASRNYGQGTLNYLKGEAEGNGNAASEAIKKAWIKHAGTASTEDLIPWISQRQYKAILTGCGIDPDTIPASPATAKMADLDALLKAEPKRQEIEAMLKDRAETLISRVVFIAKMNAAMASTNGYNLFKTDPLSKFKTTKVETVDVLDAKGKKTGERQQETTYVSIQDKKAAVDYMEKALIQNKVILDLYTAAAEAIKREGGKEKIEDADTEYEETIPLYKGEVEAYEEEQAKAARAAAREDKKADKDKELQANVILMATKFPAETIAKILHLSENKVQEIIKTAEAKAEAQPAEANN